MITRRDLLRLAKDAGVVSIGLPLSKLLEACTDEFRPQTFEEEQPQEEQSEPELHFPAPYCAPLMHENSLMANEINLVRPLTERITEGSIGEEAALRVIQWAEQNFFPHYVLARMNPNGRPEIWDFDTVYNQGTIEEAMERYGGTGNSFLTILGLSHLPDDYSAYQRLSIRDVFRERAVDHRSISFILATMLRSIGLSAEYVELREGELSDCGDGGFGAVFLPDFNKYVHGCHLAALVAQPAEDLLVPLEEQKMFAERGNPDVSDPWYALAPFYRFNRGQFRLDLGRTGMIVVGDSYSDDASAVPENTLYVSGHIISDSRASGSGSPVFSDETNTEIERVKRVLSSFECKVGGRNDANNLVPFSSANYIPIEPLE